MEEITQTKIARYYFMGLNAKEIGKILDLHPRTVQRCINAGDLKTPAKALPKTRQQKALEYVRAGFSYTETATRFKVSKATVYNWAKKAKQAKQQTTQNTGGNGLQ